MKDDESFTSNRGSLTTRTIILLQLAYEALADAMSDEARIKLRQQVKDMLLELSATPAPPTIAPPKLGELSDKLDLVTINKRLRESDPEHQQVILEAFGSVNRILVTHNYRIAADSADWRQQELMTAIHLYTERCGPREPAFKKGDRVIVKHGSWRNVTGTIVEVQGERLVAEMLMVLENGTVTEMKIPFLAKDLLKLSNDV